MTVNILVVDDDEYLRSLLTEMLTTHGYEVDVAEDGLLALKALRSKPADTLPYDIVITDIDMPRLNGVKLAQHITTEFPGLPVIAITGYGRKDTIIELLRCGVCEYLDKPFSVNELLDRLNAILGKSDHPSELEELDAMREEMQTLVAHQVEHQKKKVLEWVRGGIQHRFNQPLTVLLGNISLLSQMISPNRIEQANPEDLTAIVKDMRNAGYCLKELVALISNLKEFHTEEYINGEKILDLGVAPEPAASHK